MRYSIQSTVGQRDLFFLLTVSDNVAEGFVVQIARNVDGRKVHQGIDLFFAESGRLAGQSFDQFARVDFAIARWVQNFER